ncbi:MAG: hypothetical protein WD533_03315 [Dehalococcoidia bacterium]
MTLSVLFVGLIAACDDTNGDETPVAPTPTAGPATPVPTEVPPTPTPTPSLDEAISRVEQAIVRLSAAGNSWSGAMIGDGLILAPSRGLGSAPVASYRTHDGAEGQAWVVGRDDDYGFAVLEVVSGGDGSFYSLPDDVIPGGSAGLPSVDQEMVLLQFSVSGASVERRNARVIGSRQDHASNIRYIQMQSTTGLDGAIIMDTQGRVQAVRMPESFMLRIDVARPGEVYGMAVADIVNRVQPRLEDGTMIVREPDVEGTATPPAQAPPLPTVVRGDLHADGEPVQAGERIFVRLVGVGNLPDQWFSSEVTTAGRYSIAVAPLTGGYQNSVLEFWISGSEAAETSTYTQGGTPTVDLTFN